ncbi:MAG TPA: hypothetical protein DFR83_08100 [Deltaproteobacteria bacterium]|nr:hypothetical protein [Deltaproteobacteria bacterium]
MPRTSRPPARRSRCGRTSGQSFRRFPRATLPRRPSQTGHQINIRIGVHSGPVVAGVIGKTKFVYDLWGDHVNTASRMESHGVPGRVHVSTSTRDLAGDAFIFEPRGEVDIKGKGKMSTYLLATPSEDA